MPAKSSITPGLAAKIATFIRKGGSKAEAARTFKMSERNIYRAIELHDNQPATRAQASPRHDDCSVDEKGKWGCQCFICDRKFWVWPDTTHAPGICSKACFDKLENGTNVRPRWMLEAFYQEQKRIQTKFIKSGRYTFAFNPPISDIIAEIKPEPEDASDLFD